MSDSRSRFLCRAFRAIVVLAAGLPAILQAAEGLDLRVRDVSNGYAVVATVRIESAEEGRFGPMTVSTDEHGRLRQELPPGNYLYEVSAPNYGQHRSRFRVSPNRYLDVRFGVSPLEIPRSSTWTSSTVEPIPAW